MLKKLTIAVLSFIASSLFVVSIIFLVLTTYILQPQNIRRELEQADAYTQISLYMSDTLRSMGGEYGAIVDDNLEFESLITATIDNNITHFLAWFGGSVNEWYVYVPIDILEAQLGTGQLQQAITDSLTNQITNKRTCTAAETVQFQSLLKVTSVAEIEKMDGLNLPDCFPADPAYREQAEKLAAEIISSQNEAEPLFDQLRRELGLENVEATMTAPEFQEFVTKQSRRSAPSSATSSGEPAFDLEPVYQAQHYFTIARYAALISLGASLLIILLLAAWKGNLAVSWSKMMTSLGITLIVDAIILLVLLRLSLSQGVEKAIQEAHVTLTQTQQQVIAEIQTGIIAYFDKPYLVILAIGFAIAFTFVIIRVLLAQRTKQLKRTESKEHKE